MSLSETGINLVGRGRRGHAFRSWATAWQLGQKSVGFCMRTDRPSLFFPTPRHNLWNADLTGRAGISAPSLPGAAPVSVRATCLGKPCFASRFLGKGGAVAPLRSAPLCLQGSECWKRDGRTLRCYRWRAAPVGIYGWQRVWSASA